MFFSFLSTASFVTVNIKYLSGNQKSSKRFFCFFVPSSFNLTDLMAIFVFRFSHGILQRKERKSKLNGVPFYMDQVGGREDWLDVSESKLKLFLVIFVLLHDVCLSVRPPIWPPHVFHFIFYTYAYSYIDIKRNRQTGC